jgi:FAD/FMN-containing dehydrogenase
VFEFLIPQLPNLLDEAGPAAVGAMRANNHVRDPKNIMNPEKILGF